MPDQGRNLVAIARRASYVGSPEHKDTASFAGRVPRPRPDATICDGSFAKKQRNLTTWLRDAIEAGRIGGLWEGEFPRDVWYRKEDVVYEARLVNREQGTYKGYQLRNDEWPKGL